MCTLIIDLMLEDICKIPKDKAVIDMVRFVNISAFSYHILHGCACSLMERICLPKVTRFSTTFLCLGVLLARRCNYLVWCHQLIEKRIDGRELQERERESS